MDFFEKFATAFIAALAGSLSTFLITLPKQRKQAKQQAEKLQKEQECNLNKRLELTEQAMIALLASKIQEEYIKICSTKRKFARPYEKSNVSKLFTAYQALGGNSYIHELYTQIMNKPLLEDEQPHD